MGSVPRNFFARSAETGSMESKQLALGPADGLRLLVRRTLLTRFVKARTFFRALRPASHLGHYSWPSRREWSSMPAMTQAGKRAWAAPALKYDSELKSCQDQPCPNTGKYHPMNRAACYRFVHAEVANDDADFLPYPLTEFGKAAGAPGSCADWALSFFESADALNKKWEVLGRRLDARQRYGTHAAEIDLTEHDGLMGTPSKPAGHISLHEFVDHTPFAARVKATALLPAPKAADATASTDASAARAPPTGCIRPIPAKKPGT